MRYDGIYPMTHRITNARFMNPKGLPILLAAMMGVVAPAWANQIAQYEPDYANYGSTIGLVVDLTNNDNGAIYNSYDLALFHSLATALYALPQNQTNYASVDALMGDWVLSIRSDPAGEVNTGWSPTTGNYNPVQITHGPFGYEAWFATQQDPNQDMMRILLEIPKTQLDGDGDGWGRDDELDYLIVMEEDAVPDMGAGRSGTTSLAVGARPYYLRTTTWQIAATCSSNGSIHPNGPVALLPGSGTNFTITPAAYYYIGAVLTNGSLMTLTNSSGLSVDWHSADADGSIHAVFEAEQTSRGTPIYWLVGHGITNEWEAADIDDPDHDGKDTWEEWQTGSDPTNSLSNLAISSIVVASEEAEIRWPGAASRQYRLLEALNATSSLVPVSQFLSLDNEEKFFMRSVTGSTSRVWALDACWQDEHPPSLSLSTNAIQAKLSFCKTSPPVSRLYINNEGEGVARYALSCDAPWLAASPTSGVCAVESDRITISYDWMACTQAQNRTWLNVQDLDTGSSQNVEVVASFEYLTPLSFIEGDWEALDNIYPSMLGTSAVFTAYAQIRRFLQWGQASNFRFKIRFPSVSGTNNAEVFVGRGNEWLHNDRFLGVHFVNGEVRMWDTKDGGSDYGVVGTYPLDTWVVVNIQYACDWSMIIRGEGLYGKHAYQDDLIYWVLISGYPSSEGFEIKDFTRMNW